MAFLPRRNIDDSAKITADFMPSGRHFRSKYKPDKVQYKLFKGLSKEFLRKEGYLNDLMSGLNITNSTVFIDEWLQATGIPDDYFNNTAPLSEQQQYVITKMSAEGVSSAEQLGWLCSKMGLYVNVYPGHYFYTNPDPRVGSFSSEKESRFTIVCELDTAESEQEIAPNLFPISFPWAFGSSNYNIMRNFIESIVQANVEVRWIVYTLGAYQDSISSTDIIQDSTTSTDIVQDIVV